MDLWKSIEIAEALGVSIDGSWSAQRVVIDSRIVNLGDIYVALKGERLDGHAFISQALVNGAIVAIGEYVPEGIEPDKVVVVENTYHALEKLGQFARSRFKGKVVGLTGSVGKTTTKEMLRLSLSAIGETFASYGNFNNHIGTPLNLANLPENYKFAVFEMGMNHAGEISALTKQVQPDVAIIINVEAVHLEFFGSVANIAEAKSEIFEGLSKEGVAILNRDSEYFNSCAAKTSAKIISFGKSENSEVKLIDTQLCKEGMCINTEVFGEATKYSTKAIGEHIAYATLVAIATAKALSLDIKKTVAALAEFEEVLGRGNLQKLNIEGLCFWLLDDAYNASPASMKSAFKKSQMIKKSNSEIGRVVAVLGDMLELGESELELHKSLGKYIQEAGIEMLITVGARMKHLYELLKKDLPAVHFAAVEELKENLLKLLKGNDLVLVKGSHGSYMYKIVEHLKQVS